MENKVKTQQEIGAVHLDIKGLDKDRFKDLVKGQVMCRRGIDESLNGGNPFIENWLNGRYVWLSCNIPDPNSRLITLDELEEMIKGGKAEETKVLKVGDKINLFGIDHSVVCGVGYFLNSSKFDNYKCFEFMGTDKRFEFQEKIIGYKTSGNFPYCNSLEDLTKFVNAIKDEYQKRTNKMNKKTRVITPKEAQSIINIACEGWKPKLIDLWAVNIVQGKDVEITEDFYKEMRKACTPSQHEVFDVIFGKDEPECPYEDGELIFVRTHEQEPWHLRYSTGSLVLEGTCAVVYDSQKKEGMCSSYKYHAKAPNVKLPE